MAGWLLAGEVGVLRECIDRTQCSCLHEVPFDVGGIARREYQFSLEIEFRDVTDRR
jgi:hypothetical protein